MTVAVTLFALLELYKQGEATWEQEAVRAHRDRSAAPTAAGRGALVSPLARTIEALLFLVARAGRRPSDLADAARRSEAEWPRRSASCARPARGPARRGPARAGRRLHAGHRPAEAEAAARRLLAKPRTPPLTPAQAETLAIVAYLQPVSRPEIARIRGVSADSAAPRCSSAA